MKLFWKCGFIASLLDVILPDGISRRIIDIESEVEAVISSAKSYHLPYTKIKNLLEIIFWSIYIDSIIPNYTPDFSIFV